MRIPPGTPIHALNMHAGYRCAHSGACCNSGWPIPVERDTHRRLQELLGAGRLDINQCGAPLLVRPDGAPADTPVTTGIDRHGACVFYEADRHRCAIHRQAGHGLLPVACQQFPRVSLLDGRGLLVTVSHYCPTAAALLFEASRSSDQGHLHRDVEIVASPEAFPPSFDYDPLDAREALPPLLTPVVLMDIEVYDRYERDVVASLGVPGRTPERAVADIVVFTEWLRRWKPGLVTLNEYYRTCRERLAVSSGARGPRMIFRADDLWQSRVRQVMTVLEALPVELAGAQAVRRARGANDIAALAAADARFVEPAWNDFAPVVRRYLAAKVFGSWLAYQGRGVRTVASSLTAALSLVRCLAALECGTLLRDLDAAALTTALRQADEMWLHLASREELARRLSVVEEAPAQEACAAAGALLPDGAI